MQDHGTAIWQHSNTIFTLDALELRSKNKQLYELLHLVSQSAAGSVKVSCCQLGTVAVSRSQWVYQDCENSPFAHFASLSTGDSFQLSRSPTQAVTLVC